MTISLSNKAESGLLISRGRKRHICKTQAFYFCIICPNKDTAYLFPESVFCLDTLYCFFYIRVEH